MGHHLNIYNSDVKGKIILKKKKTGREKKEKGKTLETKLVLVGV
jgi:hypothetical protein